MTEDILVRFINNTCSDEELVMVRNWLDESDDNAAKLFGMEKIVMLAGSTRDNGDMGMKRAYADIQQRILAYEIGKRHRRRVNLYRWISAAAVVAVIMVTAIVWFTRPGVTMITVEAIAQSREVTLPDGSVVYLNKHSRLVYPEEFSKNMRDVKLSGEGFFKITHDKQRPFRVDGRYLNVTVLGTEFNFNSNATGTNNVSLVEGSVKVCNSKGTEGVVLVPGQKAEYDTATGNITVSETNAAIDAAWHDGIIPFENSTMHDIAAVLEQLYDVTVELGDVDMSKTYSGATVYYENIDSTLSQLTNTLPISFTHNGNTILIESR